MPPRGGGMAARIWDRGRYGFYVRVSTGGRRFAKGSFGRGDIFHASLERTAPDSSQPSGGVLQYPFDAFFERIMCNHAHRNIQQVAGSYLRGTWRFGFGPKPSPTVLSHGSVSRQGEVRVGYPNPTCTGCELSCLAQESDNLWFTRTIRKLNGHSSHCYYPAFATSVDDQPPNGIHRMGSQTCV